MNLSESRYSQFGLVRDMLETPGIIEGFSTSGPRSLGQELAGAKRLLLTGEGSSRIFPAKSVIARARRIDAAMEISTEAARQAQEYVLKNWVVFALSNSGRTAEVIGLFKKLHEGGHKHRYSLTASAGSMLESLATRGFVLSCGAEGAVAATKSVMEQALFYWGLLDGLTGRNSLTDEARALAGHVHGALTTKIDPIIAARVAGAGTVYWAGRNDGVAEELTLKTNEITRKKSDYLEGTYAVHGVEEVMDASDVLICVDPYPDSEEKFQNVLGEGVGLQIIAISSRPTRFPTILVPEGGEFAPFVQMAAGWNLLVEVGLELSVNLDKPQRARKVGNEFVVG